MKRGIHALCATALTVLVATGPAATAAHARTDLDCRDFSFQEDAQAEFNRDLGDPHRLDEEHGRDDGIACEVLPHRGVAVPTHRPTITPLPTQGVRGGVGGSTGPADFEVALGAGLAVGALGLTFGYVMHRRRAGG